MKGFLVFSVLCFAVAYGKYIENEDTLLNWEISNNLDVEEQVRPVLEEKDGLAVVYNYKDGEKCPAQLFYNGCNRCGCGKDGQSAICMKMACPLRQSKAARRSVKEYPHNDLFRKTSECRPGMDFMDECNYCYCSKDGKSAVCTEMGCLNVEEPRIDGYESGEACIPNETFYDECNRCLCDSNGRDAVCTMMNC